MLKKIILIVSAVLLLAYLVFSVVYLNKRTENRICNEFHVEIMDTLDRHYITDNEITLILKNAKLSPVGKDLSEISTTAIKDKLEENKLIKKVECFKTIDGAVKVKVYQRIPILRIFSNKGSYYVDNEGEIMPVPKSFAIYVPVASGNIENEYAKTNLYEFALFLQKDKFWNSQIEQIHVASNGDIELTPRVGNHQIVLGKIEDYKENLEKLKLFYDKGLNVVGWNRYSTINLKYKDQVVCTKRKT